MNLLDGWQAGRRGHCLTLGLGERHTDDVDDEDEGITLHDASLRGTTLRIVGVRTRHHDEDAIAFVLAGETLRKSWDDMGQREVHGGSTLVGGVEHLSGTPVDAKVIHLDGGVLVDLLAVALLEHLGLGLGDGQRP